MLARLTLLLVLAAPLAAAAPEQVHLGLPGGDGSTFAVNWFEATPNPDPVATLTGPDGQAKTVKAQHVPGPTAGFVYEATFDSLEPGTNYTYAVGGREFAFRTPAPGGNFTFVALGDMGIKDTSRATVAFLETLAPDLVIHAGDISYAEGNQEEWRTWFGMVEPVAANAPWMPALGNHESTPGGADPDPVRPILPTEHQFYHQRFMHHDEPSFYYSFDYGGVHFVALDTYSQPVWDPAEQLAWLEEDLKAHADAAWTIAFLHAPPYSSGDHGSNKRSVVFIPVLEKHGVDLVIAAHDHNWERTWPIKNGTVAARDAAEFPKGTGTVYLVTGGAGQSLYEDMEPEVPEWSANRQPVYHVTRIAVSPDRLDVRMLPTGDAGMPDGFAFVEATPQGPAGLPAVEPDPIPGPGAVAALVAMAAVARALGRRP